MLFFVIKLHMWQLAPESITSPPFATVNNIFIEHKNSVTA